MTPAASLPTRHRPTPHILRTHGERVDRLGAMLLEGDPLADAATASLAELPAGARHAAIDRALGGDLEGAPAALVEFVRVASRVPFWFDVERANRGGATVLRSGLLGGLVLGLKSLVGGYCSPAGNKPLMFSGRLSEDVPRRLTETSRFVQVVCAQDGMLPGAPGFRATLKVRLMHAQVRRLLTRSPKWDARAWGVPINQYDMAGTALLFSLSVTDGLRALGYHVAPEEEEDVLHLWRWAGLAMGVREELLSATAAEARALMDMIAETQDPPDEDSRALARALIENPLQLARTPRERAAAERSVRFAYGLSRHLLGDTYADQLGYPRTAWRFGLRAIRALIARADAVRRGLPFTDQLALELGVRYWQNVVDQGVAGNPVTFAMPERLRGG